MRGAREQLKLTGCWCWIARVHQEMQARAIMDGVGREKAGRDPSQFNTVEIIIGGAK